MNCLLLQEPRWIHNEAGDAANNQEAHGKAGKDKKGRKCTVLEEYCAERIYASMEKTQKGSWRILQIRQEM